MAGNTQALYFSVSIILVALPLSAGLMTMSFRSVRFLRASRSYLVRLSPIFKGWVFSISLVIRCMKRSSVGSPFLSGLQVLLCLNELSSSGL